MGCEDYHALKRDIINEHTHTDTHTLNIFILFICMMRGVCATVASSLAQHHRFIQKKTYFSYIVCFTTADQKKKNFRFFSDFL